MGESELYIGTCGFSYPYWRRTFYPEDVKPLHWLPYYANHFTSVEINMTFYRNPTERMLYRWLIDTPSDFRFTFKASRKITHDLRLKNTFGELKAMWKSYEPIRDRLSCVLFQIPPSMFLDAQRLEGFLRALVESQPTTDRIAFEFRHHSWYAQKIFEMLTMHGFAIVLHDMPRRGGFTVLQREGMDDTLVGIGSPQRIKAGEWIRMAGQSFLYLRLHGTIHERPFGEYGDRYLKPWVSIARSSYDQGMPLYAYFNNDPNAAATRDAERFTRLLAPRHIPRAEPSPQKELDLTPTLHGSRPEY